MLRAKNIMLIHILWFPRNLANGNNPGKTHKRGIYGPGCNWLPIQLLNFLHVPVVATSCHVYKSVCDIIPQFSKVSSRSSAFCFWCSHKSSWPDLCFYQCLAWWQPSTRPALPLWVHHRPLLLWAECQPVWAQSTLSVLDPRTLMCHLIRALPLVLEPVLSSRSDPSAFYVTSQVRAWRVLWPWRSSPSLVILVTLKARLLPLVSNLVGWSPPSTARTSRMRTSARSWTCWMMKWQTLDSPNPRLWHWRSRADDLQSRQLRHWLSSSTPSPATSTRALKWRRMARMALLAEHSSCVKGAYRHICFLFS